MDRGDLEKIFDELISNSMSSLECLRMNKILKELKAELKLKFKIKIKNDIGIYSIYGIVEINNIRLMIVLKHMVNKIYIFNMKSRQIETIQKVNFPIINKPFFYEKKQLVLFGGITEIKVFDAK